MISDSKRKADRKWREKAYDKICIQLPAGTRQRWKDAAAAHGLSLAGMISAAVADYLARHDRVGGSD